MKSLVNLELIFPIKDAPSASFMSFKAIAFGTLASLPKVRSVGWMPEFFLSLQAKRAQQVAGISAQPSAAFPDGSCDQGRPRHHMLSG